MENSWDYVMLMRCVLLSVFHDAAPELDVLGLHPKSFTLLASVGRFPFPAELAKHLFVPPPTITFMVKQLESMKLLTRETVAGDLRKYRLRLTKKGEDTVEKGKNIMAREMRERLKRLSKSESKAFYETLKTLQGACDPESEK